jgi:hypothetical protein
MPTKLEYTRLKADPEKYAKSLLEKKFRNRRYRRKNIIPNLLDNAKRRALKRGLEFNLTVSDLNLPLLCPLLKIPLRVSESGHSDDNSPTLDRIDPSRGYVKGNVQIISKKANQIKSNAYLFEIELLARNLKIILEELCEKTESVS